MCEAGKWSNDHATDDPAPADPTDTCDACATGCDMCMSLTTCAVCTDRMVMCQKGMMWDTTAMKCQDCAVDMCADCSEAVGDCKTCMDGYVKATDADGNTKCNVDTAALPCAAGYSKNNGTCEACPPGCASCDGLQCTSCMEGTEWIKPSTEAADMCKFNCTEYTCTEFGEEICGDVTNATTKNLVVACNIGYQYNGVTLSCGRTAATKICPAPANAPASERYYFDDVT